MLKLARFTSEVAALVSVVVAIPSSRRLERITPSGTRNAGCQARAMHEKL